MAVEHLLYTPEQAARSTLAALKYQSTLARLVNTDFSTEFVAGRGASVTVKRPIVIDKARVYTEANRAAEDAITYSTVAEPYTSIKVTDQVYNAAKLPDDFATFTLTSLEQQVIAPMAESVAEHINKVVADAFATVPAGLLPVLDQSAKLKDTDPRFVGADDKKYASMQAIKTAGTTFKGFVNQVTVPADKLKATYKEDVLVAIRSARQVLGQRGVPATGRTLVVGANWEAALLSLDNLNKVNEAGDNGALLRQATLGNLYGFTIVVDYALEPNDAYAFQRDAVTLITRTTAAPRGASFASTVAAEGFTMRYLQDYDPDHLVDRAVVDTFAGAQVLDPQRIVRLTGADTMTDKAPGATPEPAPEA
ncbi:major capsid protein [Corynebacterium phage EmiRose]|uniref:Major capsid protein n=1 Tax=Corynebacterium phage EmiRose TaxID=2565372 RepID=A0A649VQ72_9CAUD|nr:major capsid protein [Corynebacterium phage EmiRose]QGJ94139.1 major capsid protein [Corynebacterium phage EmiRose]